jgi:PKD repeat protein
MRRTKLLIFIFALFCFSTQAQQIDKLGKEGDSHSPLKLEDKFYRFQKFSFDGKTYKETLNNALSRSIHGKIQTELQLGDLSFRVELEPSLVVSNEYRVTYFDGSEKITKKRFPSAKAYKGIDLDNGKQVRITVDEGFVYGFIETEESTLYFEPAFYYESNLPKDVFFYYDIRDAKPLPEVYCGAEINNPDQELFQLPTEEAEDRSNPCRLIDYGVATDFSMFTKYGGESGVESRNIGVLNNFQPNYLGWFAFDYEFVYSEQFIVTCSGCDPWTSSTDAGALLNSFRDWNLAGGFSAPISVATLWSNRNFNGSTIGLAWLSAVCRNTIKYNICQDFSSNSQFIRVLVAHELGHNFGSNHDAAGSNFIMAPSVNTSNNWSSNSQNQINNYMSSFWVNCLSDCISDPPLVDFSANTTEGCVDLVVTFQDLSQNNPSEWEWHFPGGTPEFSTQQNPTVVYSTPGLYPVTLTATNAIGSSTLTFDEYIHAYDFEPLDYSYTIENGVLTINNNSDPNYLYFWDFGDGNVSTDFAPVHQYVVSGYYEVNVTAIGECGSESNTFEILAVLPIVAEFAADFTEGCLPFEVLFYNLSQGEGEVFEWEFEGGTPSTSNQFSPTVVYHNAGVFGVKLTVYNVYTLDSMVLEDYITVYSPPLVDFSYSANGNVYAFTNNSQLGITYLWEFGDGNTSTLFEPTHTYNQSGTYQVKLTVTNDCGSVSLIQSVEVNLGLGISVSVDSPLGCVPFEVLFSLDSEEDLDSVFWSFPGGNPEQSTELNPTVLYQNSGSFDVEVIAFGNGQSDTLVLENYIQVNALPSAAVDFSMDNLTVTLINNSENFDSIHYDMGDGVHYTNVDEVVHTYTLEGSYNIVVTLINACGSVVLTDFPPVLVQFPASASFTSSITEGCAPVLVDFINQSSENATGYLWFFEGGTPSNSTQENPSILYTAPGTFDVQLIVFAPGGNDTLLLEDYLTIGASPSAFFSFSKNDLLVTFTNQSSGADTYFWDFGDGNFSTEFQPQHTYAEVGVYTVVLIATNECGSDTLSRNVSLLNIPNPKFSLQGSSQGCTPFVVEFVNETEGDFDEILWIFEGGSPATSIEPNPTVTYWEPGIFDVTLIASNQEGSDTLVRKNYITVLATPSVDISVDYSDFTVSLTATAINGYSYQWDLGDGNVAQGSAVVHTYTQSGTYEVVLTVTGPCGTFEFNALVIIDIRIPGTNFGANSTLGCAPLVVSFFDESTNNPTAWFWEFEGGEPSVSTARNPVVTYRERGVYKVSLRASNAAGEVERIKENFINVSDVPILSVEINEEDGVLQIFNNTEHATFHFWDFGDGTTSSLRTPSHKYTESGAYTAMYVGGNACGTDTLYIDLGSVMVSTLNRRVGSEISVFPNPTTGLFNLQYEQLPANIESIELMNVLGESMVVVNFKSENMGDTGMLSFDFSRGYKGTAILKINLSDGSYALKKLVFIQ